VLLGVALLATLGTASIAHAQEAAQKAYGQLRLVAPAAPGGGWDQTARVMQQVLQQAGIARFAPVENIPGAAGTIGLARFIGAERGSGDTLMVSGLIMLGGIVTHRSPVTLRDVVPIARLTGEYEVIAVPTASPFRSLQELLTAFRARPESISWGGGSAGGSDQILAGLVADAVGVAPRRVNYIAFSGGGESLSAILGGQVSAGINGLAEFAPHLEAGTLRALAISSAVRLPGLDVPTLREQGVDVEFENWRSVVAPPGISPADRSRLEAAVAAMVRSAPWREALSRYRWLDRYLAGDDLARFADTEEQRVRDILKKFGTGDTEGGSLSSAGPYPIFVLAGLVFFGLAAGRSMFAEARKANVQANVQANVEVNVEGHVERHVERARATRALGPALLLGTGVAVYLLLAERAGFVIASAGLFWFTARAFDDRHPARDAIYAVVTSVCLYLLFARVLQLTLPAGWLARWL
jgi:putative tricarboxylic transport membrane protein